MAIGLYNIDSTIPNFALMKIASYYGGDATWCSPLEFSLFDKIYASSVFTWSNKGYLSDGIVCGGTGIDVKSVLPDEIESGEPDYDLYPGYEHALGFLTRGCIRRCEFCFVPEKEGYIKGYRDIGAILQGRKSAVLMDNNVLASDHGISEIEKIVDLGVKVDFNQGLDYRLITDDVAKLLSKVSWIRFFRLACDDVMSIDGIRRCVERLDGYGVKPYRIFVYMLVKGVSDAVTVANALKGLGVNPFAQPFMDRDGTPATKGQRDVSRWVNHKAVFKSCSFAEYSG